MNAEASVAASRFGLGPRPGELAEIGSHPREWLLDQLPPASEDPRWLALGTSAARLAQARPIAQSGSEEAKEAAKALLRATFLNDVGVRAEILGASPRPFLERWRMAWSNHFTVSVTRQVVAGLAVPFEREAIVPHATGKFLDLLRAATQHPAMLLYLDNLRSVGPNSLAGLRKERGLNENLARELLELHTLGANGGYQQADVEALAAMLTGWSLSKEEGSPGTVFRPELHQPGPKHFLGAAIAEGGPGEIDVALKRLAKHPSTARNVATRLARHFAADRPPERLVRGLERTFLESEGDLAEVAITLVNSDEAWADPLGKLRTPHDLVCAISRGFGPADGAMQVKALRALGQIPFSAPSPAGWSDLAVDWAGSDQILARIDLAERMGAKVQIQAGQRAEDLLGPVLSASTRNAIASASAPRGLALLVASPEFQRR